MKHKRLISLLLAMCMVAVLLVASAAPASATTADRPWQTWQMDCGICPGCRVVWRLQRVWCSIKNTFPFLVVFPVHCGYCEDWNGGRPTRCWFPRPIGLSEPGDVTHPYVGNMAAIALGAVRGPVDEFVEWTTKTAVRDGRFILFIGHVFPHMAQYSLELIAVDAEDGFNITLEIEEVSGGLTVITSGVLIIELDEALLDQDFTVTLTWTWNDYERIVEIPAAT